MTVRTLRAGLPEIEINPGMKLVLEAISPTTGAAITGVTTSAWAIYGDGFDFTGGDIDDSIPGYSPEDVAGE